jgi:hypothetical protein
MASRRRSNEGGRLEVRPQSQDGYPRDRQQAHVTAILYGNLRAEIVSDAGARIRRVRLQQAAADLLSPRRSEALRKPPMLGRDREAADAFTAIKAGRPAGVYAACGYGKTTLLRNIAAAAAERALAPSRIYLRAGGDRVGDLLHDLVAKLYVCDQPVKLTPQQYAQLLGQVSAVVAVDDLRASPDQVGYLLEVLSGCSLVIGSAQPVLGPRGSSRKLGGLPEESALALIVGDLGRSLTAEELAAARRLVAAVDGQPLYLRQCAALAHEGRHSFRSLARQAVHDPEVLDRLSIDALAQTERRALAALALAAGTLLPAAVVDAIGQIAYLAQWLESLHRRGLAEQCDDRFGLPACKAFCQDQLEDAYQLLQQALTLRQQIGDTDGAAVTRHNLRLLELPDPPPPPRSGVPRRALHALGGVLGTMALVVSTIAITGVLRSSAPAEGQPTGPPSTSPNPCHWLCLVIEPASEFQRRADPAGDLVYLLAAVSGGGQAYLYRDGLGWRVR